MEREENVQEAMKKTPEELVLWAIGANDNPLRLNIAKLEFERRVAAAQIETAKSTKSSAKRMLWSVLVLLLTGDLYRRSPISSLDAPACSKLRGHRPASIIPGESMRLIMSGAAGS